MLLLLHLLSLCDAGWDFCRNFCRGWASHLSLSGPETSEAKPNTQLFVQLQHVLRYMALPLPDTQYVVKPYTTAQAAAAAQLLLLHSTALHSYCCTTATATAELLLHSYCCYCTTAAATAELLLLHHSCCCTAAICLYHKHYLSTTV